ncbi:hypothetical protein IAD21_00834 [Abditibacteriota bacterium]|nr:hypothetical protein IAD21_00834 [Abditibacteriota bacterium]
MKATKLYVPLWVCLSWGVASAFPALAQDAPKPFDPGKQTVANFKQMPEIIPVATDDGGLDVAWLDHSETPTKLYLHLICAIIAFQQARLFG